MALAAKFIQITATCADRRGEMITELFALDDTGTVWKYHFSTKPGDNERWIKLAADRK